MILIAYEGIAGDSSVGKCHDNESNSQSMLPVVENLLKVKHNMLANFILGSFLISYLFFLSKNHKNWFVPYIRYQLTIILRISRKNDGCGEPKNHQDA